MDSTDVVDEVNSLLKLGVGDPYRLEHIKQTYIQNQKIWITDENYLKRLREKYLAKHNSDIQTNDEIVFENEPEDKETIHCWKCGKKGPIGANFCMLCGTSIFEVGATPKPVLESKSFTKSIPLKIPIIIGIPVLILIILGAGYSQGYFDNVLDSSSDKITTVMEDEEIFYGEFDSKCGAGTVLNPETNACVLGSVKVASSGEFDSKCGTGTVFDSESNSCVLG
ncbi:MAG: zinc ribbon domain-containing protein [Nitrosopumilus sp.]|nr:zinc ribbon domain-containing protein [Nitrosopumilus sp.]